MQASHYECQISWGCTIFTLERDRFRRVLHFILGVRALGPEVACSLWGDMETKREQTSHSACQITGGCIPVALERDRFRRVLHFILGVWAFGPEVACLCSQIHRNKRERENIYMGKYQEEVRRSAHKRISVSWTRNNNVDEAFLFFQLTNQYTVQLDRRWFLFVATCGSRIIYKTCAHGYTKELLSTGLCTRTWIASPPNIEAYALTRSCSIFAKPNLDYTHWIFAGIVFYMKS